MQHLYLLILTVFFVYTSCNPTQPKPPVAGEPAPVSVAPAHAPEPGAAKTYLNKKYGFSFQYPATWQQTGKEVEAINRKGAITSVEVRFADTLLISEFFATYYLPPTGAEIYKFQLAQFNTSQGWYQESKKTVTVADRQAIYGVSTIRNDGKGNLLQSPLQIATVEFLDKKKEGEFCLQYKTTSEKARGNSSDVEQVLNSFSFTE